MDIQHAKNNKTTFDGITKRNAVVQVENCLSIEGQRKLYTFLLKLHWLYEPFNVTEIIYGIFGFNWLRMHEMKYDIENGLFQLFIVQAFRLDGENAICELEKIAANISVYLWLSVLEHKSICSKWHVGCQIIYFLIQPFHVRFSFLVCALFHSIICPIVIDFSEATTTQNITKCYAT